MNEVHKVITVLVEEIDEHTFDGAHEFDEWFFTLPPHRQILIIKSVIVCLSATLGQIIHQDFISNHNGSVSDWDPFIPLSALINMLLPDMAEAIMYGGEYENKQITEQLNKQLQKILGGLRGKRAPKEPSPDKS